ncbi:uncharacterized protein LOC111640345 [Centruroides sculpturatus]|uniref:uncharacterized protein LOC111640345 n=1 Tax=Centruroides sculpturatus TaxID=218467 RepID=UPI000C6C8ABB|nr:uncharacterized protein LOC111640345 [Centruroides sculpturatus]
MKYSPHMNFCIDKGGKGLPNLILSRYPKIKYMYNEPDICSVRSQLQITEEQINPFTSRPTRRQQNILPPGVRTSTVKPTREYPLPRATASTIKPTRRLATSTVDPSKVRHVVPIHLIEQAIKDAS